jgi:hypothetical protein
MNYHRLQFITASFLSVICIYGPVHAQQKDMPEEIDIATLPPIPLLPDSAMFVRMVKKACKDSTYFSHQGNELRGTVKYRSDLKSYVIVYYVPNTIDDAWTGIICNCSQIDKWLNKSVIFNGRYYQSLTIEPRYGGETVFYLHLIGVRLLNK